jgi:Ca2+/H+ antiporter
MQSFRVRPNGFNELRKKTIGVMVCILTIIVLIVVLIFDSSAESADSADTSPYVLTALVVIFGFSVWNAMRRQKKIFESFRLIVDDEALIREQLYTAAITIRKQDIREIIRVSTGQFLIDGGSKLNSIIIPSQIENPDELRRILSEIRPIREKTAKAWTSYLILISGLAGMVLLFIGLVSENIIISTFCGIALSAVMLYGFIVIQRSNNIDKRMKRLSYIFIFPFISILSVTIMKLMA